MIQYPMQFFADSISVENTASTWQTQTMNGTAAVAIPPEFLGPGGGFSPEDFYCMAAANCFIATFKVIAQNSKFNFTKIQCRVDSLIDRLEKGAPAITKLSFKILLTGVSDKEKAERLLQKISQSCIVINAMKPEKVFSFEIA